MKIAYIGIDLFYDALLSLRKEGCEIVEIFTCKTDNETEFNVKIVNFAKENNIPYSYDRICLEDIRRLIDKGCKMAVCGGYYYKIPVCDDFPIVNIHPSLLPVGRGSWPMPQTILKGFTESGVTVHKIAEGFDTGDILLQERFIIDKDENLETFMKKACSLLPDMIKSLISDFDKLWQNAKPQYGDEYWEAPKPSDWTVTSDMCFNEADIILRAFYGYEIIYVSGSDRLRLIGARGYKGNNDAEKLKLSDGYIQADYIFSIK